MRKARTSEMSKLKLPFLVCLFLVSIAGSPALAQAITNGESLRDRCRLIQLTDPTAARLCRGYIRAVADIMVAGHRIDGRVACPTDLSKREELLAAVKGWINDHPQDLQEAAYSLVARALSEIYPCEGG